MRADAHYVDQLVAPGARRAAEDEARAVPVTSKTGAATATPPRVELSLLNEMELASSLSAVLSCTDLLSDGMPRLTRSVAIDMIRAETQRTICTLRAAHVLRHGVGADRRLLDPPTVLDRVAEVVAAEARLRGSRMTTAAEISGKALLRVDENAVVGTLASVVMMLSAAVRDAHAARLDLNVTGTDGQVTFAITQDSVILPEACLKMLSAGNDHVTTPETAPLAALRHVAEAYGGSVTANRLPHGTQVCLTLPIADVT
jgi:hypothetical protein